MRKVTLSQKSAQNLREFLAQTLQLEVKWALLGQHLGMQYAILTTKHHQDLRRASTSRVGIAHPTTTYRG